VRKKILALSSGGGHWIELLRLAPAFENSTVVYATVDKAYLDSLADKQYAGFYDFADVTRWNKLKWLLTGLQILTILIKTRPDIVISTGALPGYMALRLGKYFRAKTIWIDSIANAHELSASGKHVARYADLYLTQWEHLASPNGPSFKGAVL